MILTFSLMFIMAVFRARPKFLLPYMVLNTILFFAYAGERSFFFGVVLISFANIERL